MNANHTASRIASRNAPLTAAAAITAAIAALSLTACGPHDNPDASTLVGGAPATTTTATQPVAVAPQPAPESSMTQSVPPAPTDAAPTWPIAQAPAGYSQPPAYVPVPERRVADARPVDRNNIGSVESIEPIRERPQGSGAGAVIGGVLGAVVGNQFGHSAGRAAMTGLGAVGGAVAGNNIERNHREGITGYRISVRLDNGTTRTYERADVSNLQVGDRVHLDRDSFHRV